MLYGSELALVNIPWRGRTFIRRQLGKIQFEDKSVDLIVTYHKVWFGYEIRWYALWRSFDEQQVVPVLMFSQDVATTTPGVNFTYTSKISWENASNSVECIGGGANGAIGVSTTTSGAGGGGGAYTGVKNFQFATPATTTATCRVGVGGATSGAAGGDTWVNDTVYPSTGTNKVGAKGATVLASGTSATGVSGGASASAYTSGFTAPVVTNGGAGASAGASASAGGGGGGAGGPRGVGNPGNSTTGGSANAGFGGAGGSPGNPAGLGGTGKEWSQLVGCGGGGGGANAGPGTGGAGGNYGGGSGGGGRSNGVSGTPATGVIIFSWPIYVLESLAVSQGMAQTLSQ